MRRCTEVGHCLHSAVLTGAIGAHRFAVMLRNSKGETLQRSLRSDWVRYGLHYRMACMRCCTAHCIDGQLFIGLHGYD